MVASRRPMAPGAKVTSKVSLPPAATELGAPEMTKSPASSPVDVIEAIVRTPVPVFAIVKVRASEPPEVLTAAKSV